MTAPTPESNGPVTEATAPTSPVTEAVILCAGASTRMGRPKGLMPTRATGAAPCLLRAHVDAFAAAGLKVTVVLGAAADRHRAVLPPGVRVVHNANWASTSLTDSADLALDGLGAVLLTPVDVPPATPDTLRMLLATPGSAVVCHGGRDGHPVRLAPPHPRGVRLDLRLTDARRIEVSDPHCVRNLNYPEDHAEWLAAKERAAPVYSASQNGG